MKLGAHMPIRGGIWRALEAGARLQCDVVQLFVKNNLQWQGRAFSAAEQARFAAARDRFRFACVFGHTGYLINLGAPPSANRDRSIQSLIQELQLAEQLGLPFLVLHPGAHLGAGEKAGLKQAISGLNEVIRSTRSLQVRIALENTAGQGTCLGWCLRHLATIYDGVGSSRRLGLCLDTAHFFAAGYDWRTPSGWETVIQEVCQRFGLQQILAFHLNDSQADLGSRVDRHAGIGQGKIGRAAFRQIVTDVRFSAHPGCLETPKSADLHEDRRNLAILRRLGKS